MNIVAKRITAAPVFVLAALVALLLSGCEASAPEKTGVKGKPVIGVLMYRQGDIYIDLVTEAIEKTLSGRAEIELLFAQNDQMVQNDQIDALLKKNIDALALNIVDPQAAAKAVDALKKADVPVVFFNREPDLEMLKSYARARFVGTTAFDAGIMQGDIIAELWRDHPDFDRNKDGKCQYMMIQANLDNPEAVARTEYSVKQARDKGIVMQQVGETLLCNWDDKVAYTAVRLLFPLYKDTLELIIANNDSMALGAIEALQEHGFNLENGDPEKFIPVVGVDAVPRATEAVTKGIMSGTVVQDAKAMGEAIATMLMNAVEGVNCLQGLPYTWDDSGIAIRIPYARFTAQQ